MFSLITRFFVTASAWFDGLCLRGKRLGRTTRMTRIEQDLFLDGSAHWVSAFELSPEALVLTLHPCHRPETSVQARFSSPRFISKDDSYADDENDFPWDIIGFDSEQLPGGVRSAVLPPH